MHRRRKYGIREALEEYLESFHFDALYADGKDLILGAYPARRKMLVFSDDCHVF
jgi:ATP-dependent DNA ligase